MWFSKSDVLLKVTLELVKSWLRLPRWTVSWLLNCLSWICSCCCTEKQPSCQVQFLPNILDKSIVQTWPWRFSSRLSHSTLALRRRANLEVSLTESNTFRSVRRFTVWNSPQKKKKEKWTKRGQVHKVRPLCKLPSMAIEMKVSLNNPVKCSEILPRGLQCDLQPSVFFVFPIQDNTDTWVHVH